MGDAGSDGFVDEPALIEAVEAEFVAKRRMALGHEFGKPQPEPGMALNPPVPQPQLMKMPSTGVFDRIGERSPVTSTMPPHWRSILSRATIGKVSISALTVSSIWWNEPRCV